MDQTKIDHIVMQISMLEDLKAEEENEQECLKIQSEIDKYTNTLNQG